eukprot:757477-Hanusia_phi.AAC.4
MICVAAGCTAGRHAIIAARSLIGSDAAGSDESSRRRSLSTEWAPADRVEMPTAAPAVLYGWVNRWKVTSKTRPQSLTRAVPDRLPSSSELPLGVSATREEYKRQRYATLNQQMLPYHPTPLPAFWVGHAGHGRGGQSSRYTR